MTVTELLRRQGFRKLLAGQTVSALGDWMVTVAFMAVVLDITGSPTAVGGILALRLLPAAVAGPLAAKAARRWDRRYTMLAMDAGRAGMVAAVPFVSALWWIYLWAVLVEVASLIFLPARDSSVPELVEREEDLSLANGLVLGTSYGTIPLGAAAFGAVAALPFSDLLGLPLSLVFWLDAATFLVSFWFIARIPELGGGPATSGGSEAAPELGRFREALAIPLVRSIAVPTAAIALGLGALFSLGIVFVRDVLDASTAEFGWFVALFGVGAAGGIVLLRESGEPRFALVREGVLGMGVVVAAFSLSPAIGPAYLGAIAFGTAVAFTLAGGMSLLQARLDGSQRVLAFTAFHVIIRLGLGLAALGAGAAGDLLGSVEWPGLGRLEPARAVLFCSGLLVLLTGIVVRAPRIRAPAPDPEQT